MHQPRESGYRAWRAQPVAQDKQWAHGKDMGQALADEGARRDGSGEAREAEKAAGLGRTEEQIGTRSGVRGGDRRGWEKRKRGEQADGHWLGLE
ncbi:hypothetical protein ERJ75_000603200 [Trypanosoma vivax]|nr:hypothetical protein ERJ75_000603200 [Trypanosoma vivax]